MSTMAQTKQTSSSSASERKKRKHAETVGTDVPSKIHKHKKVKPEIANVSSNRPAQTSYDDTTCGMDAEQLSKHFSKSIAGQFDRLTAIELEDKSLPSRAFCNTSSFTEPRLAQNLNVFLEAFSEGGSEELRRCNNVSSPHTLVIASAAIRAQDLIRAVRPYGSEDNKIAKLFAKHMKLPESIDYVQKTKFGIGVGTPHRIKDLIEKDVLKTNDLKRIVLDVSFVDEKKRTILSQKDVFVALIDLLNLDAIKLRLVRADTQIQVF